MPDLDMSDVMVDAARMEAHIDYQEWIEDLHVQGASQTTLHTCIQGPWCEVVDAGIEQCDHDSCNAMQFGSICKGCVSESWDYEVKA